jgi:hypothetical protein
VPVSIAKKNWLAEFKGTGGKLKMMRFASLNRVLNQVAGSWVWVLLLNPLQELKPHKSLRQNPSAGLKLLRFQTKLPWVQLLLPDLL